MNSSKATMNTTFNHSKSSKSEEEVFTPKKSMPFIFSGNSSRTESGASTQNGNKNKNVKTPVINSLIFNRSNGVTSASSTPTQYNHHSKSNSTSKNPFVSINDKSFRSASPKNSVRSLPSSVKNSPVVKSNSSDLTFMKESNWRKNRSDINDLNGDHMKSIEHVKSILNSPDVFDFSDAILNSLVEIHRMSSIASLILENRKVQKMFNLSDEIFHMSLQSTFKLADLKFDTLEPVDHFHVASFVASYKQHAKYISRKRDRKNLFVCKACFVSLNPQDLESHFIGGKHQARIKEINKLINTTPSDVPDKILSKLPSSRSSSVSSHSSNRERVNSRSSSSNTKYASNSSLIDHKTSERSVKEQIRLPAECANDILSHFLPLKSASKEVENLCLACNTKVTGPLSLTNLNLEQHVNGAKHRSKLAQVRSESQNSNASRTSSSKNVSDDKPSSTVSSPLSEVYSELMSSIMKKYITGEVPLNYDSENIGILGYYCDICTKATTTDVDWLAHMNDFQHKIKVVRAGEKTGLYHCIICKVVIFCPLVTITTTHCHIYSSEHSYIKKLVEKQCLQIAKYVQRHRVLTIKSNDSSCNSYSLNSSEFPVCEDEVSVADSGYSSIPSSQNLAHQPKWILDSSFKNDRTGRRHDRKNFNNVESDDSSDDSSDDDDSDDLSEFDDDDIEYDSNDGDDFGSDMDEELEKKLSISDESGIKGKDSRTNLKRADKLDRAKKAHGVSGVRKDIGDGDKPSPSKEQPEGTKKKRGKGRRERAAYSITFTGMDRSVSRDEWVTRFSEAGRLKDMNIDNVKGTAVVTFLKRSSMRKVLGNKDLIVNKYKLGAIETAKINLDQSCLALFENEHEFENKILSTLNIIDNELNSPEGKLRLSCLKESVVYAIHSAFPACKIYEFGSRVSGLATDESDYDLFLDFTGKMYQGTDPTLDQQTRLEMIKALRRIAQIFRHMPNEFASIVPITSARVPILKFKHIKTNSQCDLSFKNGLSVENTKLVKKYLNMNAKVRWLVIAVKRWAHTCGLLSSSHFTTYAVTWLVLFFLMSKKLVPPVGSLMGPKFKNRPPIQGWRCSFDDSECLQDFEESNVHLLLGFFNFYKSFDFVRYVICTRSGTSIRKFAFKEKVLHLLPVEIRNDYLDSVSKPDREQDFSVGTCSVQDPFDLSHNVTKQVRPGVLRCFQRCCSLAASQIQKWPPFQV